MKNNVGGVMSTYNFAKPKVGSTVTVTTRFPETYIFSENNWRDNNYTNVTVLEDEKWFKGNQFKVSSKDPSVPFHVIDLKNVIELTGSVDSNDSSDNDSFTVDIKGSKGKTYTVTFNNGAPITCTCPGFAYRNTCRHLSEAYSYVDISSQNEDTVQTISPSNLNSSTNQRGENIMSTSKALSWNDRFALIDRYQPSDEQACKAFDISQEELDAARTMRDSGTMTSSVDIDVEAYQSLFSNTQTASSHTSITASADSTSADSTSSHTTSSSSKTKSKSSSSSSNTNGTSTSSSGKRQNAKSATKKSTTSTSTKRPGRRGNKIATAFGAVTSTPVDAEEFAKQHGVSISVLRQNKRFDTTPESGTVRVVKDKEKGKLMIWRDSPSSSN